MLLCKLAFILQTPVDGYKYCTNALFHFRLPGVHQVQARCVSDECRVPCSLVSDAPPCRSSLSDSTWP